MDYTMKRFFYLLIFSLWVTTSYSQEKALEVSHYLFPEFTQGIILMKNGTKNKAFLNYNSLTEEMIFKNKDNMLAIGETELELVDTVFIRDRKFITLNKKFVELISHSKYDLYVEHKCKLIPPGKPSAYGGTSETSAITSYSSINSGGRLYALKLPEDYEIKPFTFYWLKKNGELNKFISMKQLMKIYDDKKELFKDYVKKHDVKYENQESIAELIQYLETI
jgi:hypothetical protein